MDQGNVNNMAMPLSRWQVYADKLVDHEPEWRRAHELDKCLGRGVPSTNECLSKQTFLNTNT